jgi:glycogen debranching enzyme
VKQRPAQSARDAITADEGEASPFYIESNTSFQQRGLRTLKHAHTFGMFDRSGDIIAGNSVSDGIYHNDTRYLSRLELRLNKAPLLLLSSTVQEDNAVLWVDLANLAMASRGLRGGLIHVNRIKFIWNAQCYERIIVRNFDLRPHDVTLDIKFGADFADLFEVRGQQRARRGQLWVERRSDASIALRYIGLDGVERVTSLTFEPAPNRLDDATAMFEVSLGPGQGARLVLRIACDVRGQGDTVARRFYTSLRAARRTLRDSSGRATSLDSSNSLFNEIARRSVADLYMLITQTEHGAYPFAGIPWFNTPFGRDGLLTGLFTLWIDPSIAQGVLRFLAATQASEVDPNRDAEPGKILHEMRDGEMARLGEVPAVTSAVGRCGKITLAICKPIEKAAMPCLSRVECHLEAEPAVGEYCLCRRSRRRNRHRTAKITVPVGRTQSLMRRGPVRRDPTATHNVPRLHFENIRKIAVNRDIELKPHRLHTVVGDVEVLMHAAADRSTDCEP